MSKNEPDRGEALRAFMKNHQSAHKWLTCFGENVESFDRDQLLWCVYQLAEDLERARKRERALLGLE